MTTDRAVLSVDFETFTHTPAYRNASGRVVDDTLGLSVWPFLRDALTSHDADATYFVVSEIAETHPDVVRDIADSGHEIGSHTHNHRLLSSLDEGAARRELSRSRTLLENVSGSSVTGFRAPAFDISPTDFEELDAAGYRYDSSITPCRSIPGWYGGDHDVQRPCPASALEPNPETSLMEVPVSVMPGLRLPLTGAWVRFFGRRYTALGMRILANRGITPVLYVHPWELVDLPAVDGVPKRVYWRTGKWMRKTLKYLLSQPFEFVTIRSLLSESE